MQRVLREVISNPLQSSPRHNHALTVTITSAFLPTAVPVDPSKCGFSGDLWWHFAHLPRWCSSDGSCAAHAASHHGTSITRTITDPKRGPTTRLKRSPTSRRVAIIRRRRRGQPSRRDSTPQHRHHSSKLSAVNCPSASSRRIPHSRHSAHVHSYLQGRRLKRPSRSRPSQQHARPVSQKRKARLRRLLTLRQSRPLATCVDFQRQSDTPHWRAFRTRLECRE